MSKPAATTRKKPALRPASTVMRLSRLGSFHQSRLSFMRVLLRRLKDENWTIERRLWEIGPDGVGRAVYTATGPERSYSLVAFAHYLPDHLRTDRVIAEAWDATFCLFDGIPGEADLKRLEGNVPRQEAGRITASELSLSRANRSGRLWNKVIDALASGVQPDADEIAATGYLMRTTAVYGSGKFGAADRNAICERPECSGPFQMEMLSVYLTRQFVFDLVDHLAAAKGGSRAVKLDRTIKRSLGIGNSTGLGMAPFLINHPTLLHAWINARETALCRIRGLEKAGPREVDTFLRHVHAATGSLENWQSGHKLQQAKIADLKDDMDKLRDHLSNGALTRSRPWDHLYSWAEEHLSVEGQEKLVSLMMEPYGDLVDNLAAEMSSDEAAFFRIDGSMRLHRMMQILTTEYGWALDEPNCSQEARFWYVSEAKLEPRLGERDEEPGAELELPLDIARQARKFHAALLEADGETILGDFLLQYPEYRYIARRAQIAATLPYAEIRDNLIAADMLPIDMLRCKLSFFGAAKFDPRSDRWVRISMYQNAPLADEIADAEHVDDLAGAHIVPVD